MTTLKMDRDELESRTLGHYDNQAVSFFEGTRDHDVSQNYREFLAPFDARINDKVNAHTNKKTNKKLDILDFGCGPGRDLKYFSELGHRPIGLDGSAAFCEMAKQYSGCEVLHQRFTGLALQAEAFDGVFANASLFHVQKPNLPAVLKQLNQALRQNGVLFMSNPRGNNESWSGTRYGNYMEYQTIEALLQEANFEVIKHYYRPEGKPINEQPWLAVVCRKN